MGDTGAGDAGPRFPLVPVCLRRAQCGNGKQGEGTSGEGGGDDGAVALIRCAMRWNGDGSRVRGLHRVACRIPTTWSSTGARSTRPSRAVTSRVAFDRVSARGSPRNCTAQCALCLPTPAKVLGVRRPPSARDISPWPSPAASKRRRTSCLRLDCQHALDPSTNASQNSEHSAPCSAHCDGTIS